MEHSLILETTFLIDLEREVGRGTGGPARTFLERHLEDHLYITPTVAGELAAGVSPEKRAAWDELIRPFQILAHTKEVCWEYGETYRYLRENRRLIGANDLWIAAAALAHDMPLVTRNGRDFRRVPRLRVIDY